MCDRNDTKATEEILEALVQTFMTAFNDRNFDPTLAPWSTSTQDLETEPIFVDTPGKLDLRGQLQRWAQLTLQYPDFRVGIRSITTAVHPKQNSASCLVIPEFRGLPKELTRPVVNIPVFRRVEGVWKWTKMVVIPGVLGDGLDPWPTKGWPREGLVE